MAPRLPRSRLGDMSTTTAPPSQSPSAPPRTESTGGRLLRVLLTQRIALLAVLIVVVVVNFMIQDAGGYLTASYDFDYMSASLINAVPLAMLGLAELLVILSGRGGIDLSVGASGGGRSGWPSWPPRSSGRCAARSTGCWWPTSGSPR